MKIRINYGQLAAKLDYATLDKKLEQLSQREPPRKYKTAADALEPLRERLLDLHRKGWSSGQLVEELKAAGVPISPARFRECLNRWKGDIKRVGKSRAGSRQGKAQSTQSGTGALSPGGSSRVAGRVSTSGEGQSTLKFSNS